MNHLVAERLPPRETEEPQGFENEGALADGLVTVRAEALLGDAAGPLENLLTLCATLPDTFSLHEVVQKVEETCPDFIHNLPEAWASLIADQKVHHWGFGGEARYRMAAN